MPLLANNETIYNFTRDYDSLPLINVPLRVVDPATQDVLWAGIDPVEGFANSGYRFKIFPDFTNVDPNGLSATFFADDYRYFLDLGDGTITTDLTADHFYKYPGDYKLTLVAVDSATNFYRTAIQPTIKVTNAISDQLFLTYTDGSSALNSTFENPLQITRYNSYQTWPSVSASGGYSINLSVSGNRSDVISSSAYYSDTEAHFKQFSTFVQVGEDGQGKVVDTIKTNNDPIYGILNTVSDDPRYFLYPTEVPGSIFLGTSGTSTFYYYED